MKLRRSLLICLPFLILSAAILPAHAAERVQCGSINSTYMVGGVGYCAMLPPSYDTQKTKKFPVLYFLHGLGGDQSFLVSSGGWQIIEDMWEQHKLGEFVIITPQADTSFYINSKDGRVQYEDFFIRDFIPRMEKKFRLTGTRSGRAIGGVSMGGYGALRFAFKYPQMFVSVAAHMPALLEQLPKGAANAGFNAFFGSAFGRPVDEAFWKANTPLSTRAAKTWQDSRFMPTAGRATTMVSTQVPGSSTNCLLSARCRTPSIFILASMTGSSWRSTCRRRWRFKPMRWG